MSTDSTNAAVLTDQINLAHAVAIRYTNQHPRFLKQFTDDDCVSLSNLVVCECINEGQITDNLIARRVENAMFSELRRQKKHAERHESIEVDEFGEPIADSTFSLRDLRSPQSLNPRASKQDTHEPLTKGFVAALGEVCESAVRQTQETHPLHAEYIGAVGVSRDLVSQSLADRKLQAEMLQRNADRMARRKAA